MHSFLSKVFGRKKDDKETSPTTLAPGELLDGRFEAVSPNVSPSANHFLELDSKANGHSKEKDNTFTFFREKSRPASPQLTKKLDILPHLSLNFSDFKERPNDPDLEVEALLTDAVIGQRRLNPLEALVLIRACSQAIIARGLETLGVMHPHWYSSSPEIQRRLISHFLNSLAPQSAISPLSPTLSSPISSFESEVHFTRDPHDIATVLRWGLRHLQLEGDSFGTDDGWYKAFLDAESAAEYPPKAFSEKLAPNLPPAHLELLIATLEIFSSLAAHSEANSTNGSKLSKIFGLWLLTARRVEDKDDWQSFYSRWERTGRMLEHLFLARIRDESADQRMPIRLLELVRKYPYTQGLSSPTTDLQLLPRPRFTTSLYDALFVRVEFEYPTESRKPKLKIHPLNLLADAFSASVDSAEYAELWATITAASKDGSDPSPLSNIFADETIRFLSLVSDGKGKEKEAKSPTFSILPLSPPTSPVKRSFSTGDEPSTSTAAVELVHNKSATDPVSATPISPLAIGSDWAQFSSSGFLDSSPAIVPLVSTLFDTDIEKTVPPDPPVQILSRKSSRRAKRKSIDVSRTVPIPDGFATEISSAGVVASTEGEESGPNVKATKLEIIQFDEAFIDFWSDSLLDPITSKWPTFIICKFKSTLVPKLTYGVAEEGKPQKTLNWLILEQVYTVKPPPPPPPLAPLTVDAELTEAARPSSPTASTSGKKRWFWSVSRTPSSSSATSTGEKSRKKTPKISEMGELIEEEGKKPPSSPTKSRISLDFGRKSVDQKIKSVDQGKKSLDQKKSVVQPAAIEASTTSTAAVVAAAAVVATGAAVLAAVPEDRPVQEEEQVEGQKGVPVTDADVKVSALDATTASHAELLSEPIPISTTEVATSDPVANEEIAKLEPVSSPIPFKAGDVAPVIEEEKIVEGEAAKELEIIPAAIKEEEAGEADATKEEAVEVGTVPAANEEIQEGEAGKEVEIVPAAFKDEEIGDADVTKEEAVEVKEEVVEVKEDVVEVKEEVVEEKEEVVEEKEEVVEVKEEVLEVGIVPAIEEEKVGESEATKEEVDEKIEEAEVVKEVEIVPAAVEEEHVREGEATTEEVEDIPAAIGEKAIDAEIPKEELVADVPPSVPVVEAEISVEPEFVKEGIPAAEFVAPPIVEAEEEHVVEAVAPVVEEEKAVEVEPIQEEVSIPEATVQPPAPAVEVSSAVEEATILEQHSLEETKADASIVAAEEIVETGAEPLPVIQPPVAVVDNLPVTEPEALESAKVDEISGGTEDTKVDTEGAPIVEEIAEPVSVPADSASEDVVVVEQEETTQSALPVTEIIVAAVEEETSPAPEHIQEVSAVPLAEVDPEENAGATISANTEIDVDEENISLEGFSVVPAPEPATSSEAWEEVLAVSESEHAIPVDEHVEQVPVVPVPELTASDEEGVLVTESEHAVEIAEEKAEEAVGLIEPEIVSGQSTDELAEAKEEDVAEQMKVEVVEEDIGEVVAKEVEAGTVDELVEETSKEVEDEVDEVDLKVEEEADEIEQKLEGPVVGSVVSPETEETSEPAPILESDPIAVEEEVVTPEHDFLAPQALAEDEAAPASAQGEEVSPPTEEVVSAISTTLGSTGIVQEEDSEVISPKHVEEFAPVPSIEAIALNDEERLDAESGAEPEIIETKPEEPQGVVEGTNTTVPVVETDVGVEDVEVHVVDGNAEEQEMKGEDEVLPPSNGHVETETGVIVGEVEGPVAEVEDNASGEAEADVEVPAEVAEENAEVAGERVEEISTGPMEAATLAVDQNAAEIALETAVEPVGASEEKGEQPLAAVEEETASPPSAPLEEAVTEEAAIDSALCEPTLDLSTSEAAEEVTPQATEGVEEELEEPNAATIKDENGPPLAVPESVEEVEGKVEEVVDEVEAPLDTASEVMEDKDGVPVLQAEEEASVIPAVASGVLLETALEESAVLHEESPTSSSAREPEATNEAEAGPVEHVDRKEEAAIVEGLAPENTSSDPIVPIEEDFAVHIPKQDHEAEEVEKTDEVTLALEETTVPVEAVENVEVTEENTDEHAVIEDEAEPSPTAISEPDLGASSEAVQDNSGDEPVEEQAALIPEHTAEPANDAVEDVVEATEPDVEEPATHTETHEAVVLSESDSLAGPVENVDAVEEVVPSSEDAIIVQPAEALTLAEIEVAPIPVSAHENVEEEQVNGIDQAREAEIAPGQVEPTADQAVEIAQKELEQHPATDRGVIEAGPIIETELVSGPVVASEGADEEVDHRVEEEAVGVDEAESHPRSEASNSAPAIHEENSSLKGIDPTFESKDALDTSAALETLGRAEPVEVLPVVQPIALEPTFAEEDQQAATIIDAVETSKFPSTQEPDTPPTALAEEITSHDFPNDEDPPILTPSMEADEQTENAPKPSEELLSVDPVSLDSTISTDAPLVGPSEDANPADLDMSPGGVDRAIDTPSALPVANGSVEESSSATQGEHPFVEEEPVDHISTVPIPEALESEPNAHDASSEMESHRDVVDDAVPVLEAEPVLEAPITQVEEFTPLSETSVFVTGPASVPSELSLPDVPAVDGNEEETSIPIKNDSEVLPPVDESEKEVSEPAAVVDSLPDNQNTTLEAAIGGVPNDPPSVTESALPSEINLPTLVEGFSAATLVESTPVSEEPERKSVEVEGAEADVHTPDLERETTEPAEVGVDNIREGPPTIEEPIKTEEETLATDPFPEVADGVGDDVTPSQELVPNIQSAEESAALPPVESVLATSPLIEVLSVPQGEESTILETVEEVEAAANEDFQPISKELVAEAEADVDPVIPVPDIAAESETTEAPAEELSAPHAENVSSTEAESEPVEEASPQDPITEVDEPTSLQVEESAIAEPESALVDASTIEGESIIESENVEHVPDTPPVEEPLVAAEGAQHEESTLFDEQKELGSAPDLIGDSVALESESIRGQEHDTGPIVEEASAPAIENQLIDQSAPSNGSVVEDPKVALEEPIAVDAPIVEDTAAVVETPLEATPSVAVVDEPDLPDAIVDDAKELANEPEALNMGGGIDLTLSEVEVPKAPELASVAEIETSGSTGDAENVDIVDKAPEAEVVTDLLQASANGHDATKDLSGTTDTTPVEAPEDSASSVEVVPEELETQKPPVDEADVAPTPNEDALVENAQNEGEMALESNVAGDSVALVSQESIAVTEESDAVPIVEEDSTAVAENQLVDEIALPIENVIEGSTVELEDPIAIPKGIAEEAAIVETIVVEAPSVVGAQVSSSADSDQEALAAEDSTDLFKALSTHGENDLTSAVEVPQAPEVAAVLAVAEKLSTIGDAEGVDAADSTVIAPEPETLDAIVDEHRTSKDLEGDSNPPGETSAVEFIEESATDKTTQIELSSDPLLVSAETNDPVAAQPISGATEAREAEEHPTLETVANDSTTVETQPAEELAPPVALEEPIENESSSTPPDVTPNVVDAEIHPDLEEEPKTVTAEDTEISPTPIHVPEEPMVAETDSLVPPNETLLEYVQVEEGSNSVPESAAAESIIPGPDEASPTANFQESKEDADRDSLQGHEPTVIQQHEPSDVDAHIPTNVDALTKDLVTETEESIITPEENISDSAPLETPSIEETSQAAPADEASTIDPTSALIVDDLPSSRGATADELPVSSDDILADLSHPTEVAETALEESAPTAIEDPMPREHLEDPTLDATTIVDEPVALAVEGIELEDEIAAVSSPVIVESAITEEQTTVEGEPTLTPPSVESATSEYSPAIEETTTVINPSSDDIANAGQNEASLLDNQSATDQGLPLSANSLEDSKSVVEDDGPVDGPVPAAAPDNVIAPLNPDDPESTPIATEESPPVVEENLPIVQDTATTEIASPSSIVEEASPEHIAEEPVTPEPVAGPAQTLETTKDENVAEISAPNELDSTIPIHESLADNPDLSDAIVVEDVAPIDVHGSTPHEPTVADDLLIVQDTTPIEVEVNAAEPISAEPAEEPTESLETTTDEGREASAEISAPVEEVVADALPASTIDDVAAIQEPSPIVVPEEVAPVVDVEDRESAPHESTAPEDPLTIGDTTATEVATSSSIVDEQPVEATVVEPAAGEPTAEPTESLESTPVEGGNVAAEVSAPTEEVVTAAESDSPTPFHDDLVDKQESPIVIDEDVAPAVIEEAASEAPQEEDPLIVEDTTTIEVAPPSSIVVEDGSVEPTAAEQVAEEPTAESTESLETTPVEGGYVAADVSAPIEEGVTTAEPDSTTPIHDDLVDNQESPIVVEEDVAPAVIEIVAPAVVEDVAPAVVEDVAPAVVEDVVPAVVEESAPHEEDPLIVEDTTTTEVVPPSSIVVEDGPVEANAAEHVVEEPPATESLETSPAEGGNVTAEVSMPTEEVVAAAEPDSTTPIHDDLADNQPIVVNEDVAPEPTLHELTSQDPPDVQDSSATEIAPPSNIVTEDGDGPIVAAAVENNAEVVEGENVVTEISAPLEEVTTAAEPDPIHEDLSPPPATFVNEDVAPVDVEDQTLETTVPADDVTKSLDVAEISAPIEEVATAAESGSIHEELSSSLATVVENVAPADAEDPTPLEPAAPTDDVATSLDVSSNAEATELVSASDPDLESSEPEPITSEVETDDVLDDLSTQEEEDLASIPALDHSDVEISSQEFEDIILELEAETDIEVPVSDGNGDLSSSDLDSLVDGPTAPEEDKAIGLDQEILAIDDSVAAAEVAAEPEIVPGNGHSEFPPDKEVSVEAPSSNGHGHKIDDEILEVPKVEAEHDSNPDQIQAEVSTGNGHDSKAHDDILLGEVAELSSPPISTEADATPNTENR